MSAVTKKKKTLSNNKTVWASDYIKRRVVKGNETMPQNNYNVVKELVNRGFTLDQAVKLVGEISQSERQTKVHNERSNDNVRIK